MSEVEEIVDLRAEVTRLRSALEYIADHDWTTVVPAKDKWMNELIEVAKNAIKGKQ